MKRILAVLLCLAFALILRIPEAASEDDSVDKEECSGNKDKKLMDIVKDLSEE